MSKLSEINFPNHNNGEKSGILPIPLWIFFAFLAPGLICGRLIWLINHGQEISGLFKRLPLP